LRKFVQQQEVIDEKDSLKIEHNAENWLKTNLNIDVNILKCNFLKKFLFLISNSKLSQDHKLQKQHLKRINLLLVHSAEN